MKVHEYQAKEILRRFGVAVPDGGVAFSVDEAADIASRLGGRVVIKAQIHAGGRGKGGGVKLANGAFEARKVAGEILGMTLVTHQTGTQGKLVKKVLVERAYDIDRELYLGITLDRSTARVTVIASPEGGVEIEKVAANSPEKIFKAAIDVSSAVCHPPELCHSRDSACHPREGGDPAQKRELDSRFRGNDILKGLGLTGKSAEKFIELVTKLCNAYIECDCSLAEINPLVVTSSGDILALDAKINLDDNALYRHEDLKQMMDPDEESPAELEASAHDLNYISLNGDIGCMVNGAGLAMATMDIIKLCGGEPANFLDVGGGATEENVTEAFKIILRDPKVKAILINIFGGIVKCDLIVKGITAAAKGLDIKVPLVVRLQGTNVEMGRKILAKSNLNIVSAETLDEAAKKVVECAKISPPL